MSRGGIIILALATGFLIIGIHQTITLGFEVSYWIFMISLSLLFLFRLVNAKPKAEDGKPKAEKKEKKKEKIKVNRRAKRHMERLK